MARTTRAAMPAVAPKKFDIFKGTFPYASELFGVYQPLLGWKSRITKLRYNQSRAVLYQEVADRLMMSATRPPVVAELSGNVRERLSVLTMLHEANIRQLEPLWLSSAPQPYVAPKIDSAIARLVHERIGATPPNDWEAIVGRDAIVEALDEVRIIILDQNRLAKHPRIQEYVALYMAATATQDDAQASLQSMFQREASIAGYLTFLEQHHPSALLDMFFKTSKLNADEVFLTEDPLLSFGANNYDAILSPVGMVHLYRQYFFEFESFLGPSIGHVWLSPGGTVELIEVNTRKVYTERTLEMMTETVQRSETQVTTQDDLADAVKEENQSSIKFGFSNVANYNSAVFHGTATATFSLDNEKASTRETTHKRMRQQSEKLSSEIKRSFKTTFKTSTEVTDTTSKRYVLQNKTKRLVNYELRRKMRKVGVQVQDIGVQLCWQTFVDHPSRSLGVGRLVHIADRPDGDLTQPDAVPVPQVATQEVALKIPFVGIDTDDRDNGYTQGSEHDVAALVEIMKKTLRKVPQEELTNKHIEWKFPQEVTFNQSNYTLTAVELDPQGSDAKLSDEGLASAEGSSRGKFTVCLDYVHFHNQASISITANLIWSPTQSALDAVNAENESRVKLHTEEKARRFKEAFYKAARDRIKLASKIEPRPAEDLREEERTVVYRSLINQLMSVGTNQNKHVTSELVRSIFDVDRLLYFVAPEWWAPRLHRSSKQKLGEPEPDVSKASGGEGAGLDNSARRGGPTVVPATNVVEWGGGEGGRDNYRNNYYITEDASPAKLGASLGWLLQLDGDNLRNVFLNSPWVKAVIPIRLGKERAAINWLQQAHVEGSEGLDAKYIASAGDPPELRSTRAHQVLVRDALDFLIEKISEFDVNSRTPIDANPMDPADATNHFVGSLPSEAVFEDGFYPLKGGTRFDQDGTQQAIFSQWVETLPTDQVAALEVEYDPKTLQVKVTSGGSATEDRDNRDHEEDEHNDDGGHHS